MKDTCTVPHVPPVIYTPGGGPGPGPPLAADRNASGPPPPQPQGRHPQADRQILIFDSPDVSQQLRATSVWCKCFLVSLWLVSSPSSHSVQCYHVLHHNEESLVARRTCSSQNHKIEVDSQYVQQRITCLSLLAAPCRGRRPRLPEHRRQPGPPLLVPRGGLSVCVPRRTGTAGRRR